MFNISKQDEGHHVHVIQKTLATISKEEEKKASRVWGERGVQRPHLDREWMESKLEKGTEWCKDMLSKVPDRTVKKRIRFKIFKNVMRQIE